MPPASLFCVIWTILTNKKKCYYFQKNPRAKRERERETTSWWQSVRIFPLLFCCFPRCFSSLFLTNEPLGLWRRTGKFFPPTATLMRLFITTRIVVQILPPPLSLSLGSSFNCVIASWREHNKCSTLLPCWFSDCLLSFEFGAHCEIFSICLGSFFLFFATIVFLLLYLQSNGLASWTSSGDRSPIVGLLFGHLLSFG